MSNTGQQPRAHRAGAFDVRNVIAGLVYSETPKEQRTDPDAHRLPWYQSPTKLAGIALVMVVILNVIFR